MSILVSIVAFAIYSSIGTASDIVESHIAIDKDAGSYLAYGILQGIGVALMFLVLRYLYRVVKYRREELPRGVLPLATYAPLALGLVALASTLHQLDVAERVVAELPLPPERAESFAEDEQTEGPAIIIGILGVFSAFGLAAALILLSQNARRAGILTNFIGIIGIIVGAFMVIGPLIGSFLGPIPIVQWFFLGALAALFLGYWPTGRPKAWETGEEEPWPSAQEIREQRGAQAQERRERKRPDPEPLEEPVDEDEAEDGAANGAGPAHPRSKKRKRKRKR